jgi:integrase
MSINRRGNVWQVKWRQGSRQRSRSFTRKTDALTFESEVRRRKQMGPALMAELDRQTMTLAEYVSGPWRSHAATLSASSRMKYAWALERHLSPLLDEALIGIDVPMLAGHQRVMLDRGCTASTVREVWARLSGVMQLACEHGYVTSNPVRTLRKPRADAGDEVDPLTPLELERVIASLDGRDRVICLLGAHLGLRPLEVRAAPWSALGDRLLSVGKSRTKATARRSRVVVVPEVTMQELREWRLRSGRPVDEHPIVGEMTQNAMKLWGRRVLRPAITRATKGRIDDGSLYLLRHSHASALHYAGFTLVEAAKRLGHGPELHLKTYAHVIESMSGERWPDLDRLIASARADLTFPKCSPQTSSGHAD